MIPNPVGKVTFLLSANTASPPASFAKRGLHFACGDKGPLQAPAFYPSGTAARAAFGESYLARAVEQHIAQDPSRTPLGLQRLPTVTAGVLYLDTTGVTGSAIITPDSVQTPKGFFEPEFEVLNGGVVGVDGIVLLRSPDEGRSPQTVNLGTATSVEIPGLGIKIQINVPEPELVALANDARQQYIDHIANTGGVWHTAADATNTVTHAAASTRATAYTLLNELTIDYEAHRILTTGGVHSAPDATNVLTSTASVTTDYAAVLRANDLKAKFNLHREQGTIHALDDTVNVVTVDDALQATLNAGDIVTGYTSSPRWNAAGLTAAFVALIATNVFVSMINIGEPLDPSDATVISAGITALEAAGRDVHILGSYRMRYRPTIPAEVTVTFSESAKTITRSTGSWIADRWKVGMRAEIADSASNDGTFVRVTNVSATVLTFTASVVFTNEGPVAALMMGSEEESDYYANLNAEWSAVTDYRISLTVDEARGASPSPTPIVTDRPFNAELLTKLIIDGIPIEPGQVLKQGNIGGALGSALSMRIYEGNERIHYDANEDATLALPFTAGGVQATVLRRQQDGRSGAFVARGLTLAGPTDAIDTIVKARLANEWKRIVRTKLVDNILVKLFPDPQDPNRLSEGAAQQIEASVIPSLRSALSGMVSNLDAIGQDAIFSVDRDSDLSTSVINCFGKIITALYPSGFNVNLAVQQPGQVS